MPNIRKSALQHKLAGTYRPTRHDQAATMEENNTWPTAPEWLSEDAHSIWNYLQICMESERVIGLPDVYSLSQYCELLAEFQAAPQEFQAAKHGVLIRLANTLMLNPTARARVPAQPIASSEGGFAALL